MTSHPGRLYALALSVVVFFLAWTVVAAHPWQSAAADQRRLAVTRREAQLRHEAKLVQRVVAARWAVYRRALRNRRAAIAAAQRRAASASAVAPSAGTAVRVVMLPPLTITRTS